MPSTVQNKARFCFVLNFANTRFSCLKFPQYPTSLGRRSRQSRFAGRLLAKQWQRWSRGFPPCCPLGDGRALEPRGKSDMAYHGSRARWRHSRPRRLHRDGGVCLLRTALQPPPLGAAHAQSAGWILAQRVGVAHQHRWAGPACGRAAAVCATQKDSGVS